MQNAPITKEIEERAEVAIYGLAIGIVFVLAGIFLVVRPMGLLPLALGVVLILAGVLVLAGLYMLQPNEAAILLLFGEYRRHRTAPKGCAGPIRSTSKTEDQPARAQLERRAG